MVDHISIRSQLVHFCGVSPLSPMLPTSTLPVVSCQLFVLISFWLSCLNPYPPSPSQWLDFEVHARLRAARRKYFTNQVDRKERNES